MTGHWKILTAFLLLTAAVTLTVVTVKGHTDNSGNTTEETGGGPYGSSEHISINEFLSNDLSSSSQFSALDSYIERFMKRWEIKGGSLAVMKDGQLIYSKGYGWADEEKGIRMSPGHIMRIASLSKLVTATAIMQLCERKVLSLDDRVFGDGGILDCGQFSHIRDKRVRNITVNQLLRHEAGFTMHKGDPLFTTREIIIWEDLDTVPDMDRVIEYALGERLGYTPGQGFRYSNLGYLILTKIVEVCSGMDYDEYCQQNILHPAGCYDMHLAGNYYEDRFPNEVRYYMHAGSELCEEYKPDLVIVDPLLSYIGCDISRQDMCATFLRNTLNPIITKHNIGLIFIHHTGKPSKESKDVNHALSYLGIGSSELTNWARAVSVIRENAEDPNVFEFIHAKRASLSGTGAFTYMKHSETAVLWELCEKPLKKVKSEKVSRSKYTYLELETMPPKKHDKDPNKSEVIAYIQGQLAKFGDPADTESAVKVYEAVRKNNPLIVFRKPYWHGRLYIPEVDLSEEKGADND